MGSALDEVTRHLQRGDYEAAWTRLEREHAQLERDPELAVAWMQLLEATPDRTGGAGEARRCLDAFANEPRVVIAACAALVAIASLRPMDEPPLESEQGPAQLAAEAARRCLDALDDRASDDPDRAGYLWINRANALRHLGPRRDEDAQAAYERALSLAPERGAWWFDLAVLHKWRARFEQCLDCTLRARARLGETKPVLWNLAIAATALGQGDVAAKAWRDLGIPAEVQPDTGMPWVEGMPAAQLRVPTKGTGTGPRGQVPDAASSFEVVSVAPLSPCHGVVQTPTFREALVDYGDVVLWDGAPVGMPRGPEGPVPRFALLARLREGDERRMRFVGLQQRSGEVERLGEQLPEGTLLYVHSERVEHLCPRCASGEAMRKHDHEPPEEHRIVYGKLVVPASVDLHALRHRYEDAVRRQGTVALALPGLYEALGDTRKAGQQHQAWHGIERSADKRGLTS